MSAFDNSCLLQVQEVRPQKKKEANKRTDKKFFDNQSVLQKLNWSFSYRSLFLPSERVGVFNKWSLHWHSKRLQLRRRLPIWWRWRRGMQWVLLWWSPVHQDLQWVLSTLLLLLLLPSSPITAPQNLLMSPGGCSLEGLMKYDRHQGLVSEKNNDNSNTEYL